MTAPPPPIEPEGVFEGLRWSAIVRGAVLDNLVTFAVLLPLALVLAGSAVFSEDEEVAGRALEEVGRTPEFLFWSAVLGLSITIYAGFYAARRAGRLHVRHGGWTAVASAALGASLSLIPGAAETAAPLTWSDALITLSMVPAGVLGGWLAARVDEAAAR